MKCAHKWIGALSPLHQKHDTAKSIKIYLSNISTYPMLLIGNIMTKSSIIETFHYE